MNGEATRFKEGNKAGEKWSYDDAEKVFNEMLQFAIDNKKVVSVQQAYIEYGMPSTTYYYLEQKFPALAYIKKGINDIIISRINTKALEGDYNATASIWRFKQLGETDRVENHNINEDITQELTEKERKERIKELRKKLGDK